jgi:hypothetical protein
LSENHKIKSDNQEARKEIETENVMIKLCIYKSFGKDHDSFEPTAHALKLSSSDVNGNK